LLLLQNPEQQSPPLLQNTFFPLHVGGGGGGVGGVGDGGVGVGGGGGGGGGGAVASSLQHLLPHLLFVVLVQSDTPQKHPVCALHGNLLEKDGEEQSNIVGMGVGLGVTVAGVGLAVGLVVVAMGVGLGVTGARVGIGVIGAMVGLGVIGAMVGLGVGLGVTGAEVGLGVTGAGVGLGVAGVGVIGALARGYRNICSEPMTPPDATSEPSTKTL